MICNTPINYDDYDKCPHCDWIIERFLSDDSKQDLDEIAHKFLKPHRQNYLEKQQLKITYFSWHGYSKALEVAMNEKNKSKNTQHHQEEAILNCSICNHLFDWNNFEYCPNCNWQVIDFIGDMEHTAVLLRPEREAWIAKKNYKVSDFSYAGYVPALVEAMKKQFTLEDFNSNYSPSFFKDWDEDSDLLNARLSEKPIFLGVATWINKLYQPSTGHFPIEIAWHSRITDKNQNDKYYVILDKSIAKATFNASPNPEVYLILHFDDIKQIYAEQAFLIANQQIFEIQPLDSIQLLEIQGDDEASEQNQNAEAQDAEMQTQFKPKIIKPLPKPIVSQQNDSIYSTYCDFMGKLHGRKYTSDDLDAVFTHDDRLLYLFELSIEDILNEDILNEDEPAIVKCIVDSKILMNYLCKLTKLIKTFTKNELMMSEILQSSIAMTEISNSDTAMRFFIKSNEFLAKFGASDIAIQAIVNSDLAMDFVKNNINCFSALCQKISNVSIKKLALKIIDFNPESFEHFDDVVNSSEAMNAIANSEIAMKAINSSKMAIGKYVIKLVNLKPEDFKDIDAVVDSEIAMNAILNSEIAMKAIANSENAMKTINTTKSALDVLYQHAKKINYRESNWKDVLKGKHLLVRVKCVGNDYNVSFIKIDNNHYTTSENFNTDTGRHYSNGQLIDNQLRLVNQSLSAHSYCTVEFAYYKL